MTGQTWQAALTNHHLLAVVLVVLATIAGHLIGVLVAW